MTDTGAPQRQIIEIGRDGTLLQSPVPETTSTLQQAVLVGDSFYLAYLGNGRTGLHRRTVDGTDHGEVSLLSEGSLQLHPSLSNNTRSLFYTHESFTDSASIFEFSHRTGRPTLWAQSSLSGVPGTFRVEHVAYRSQDGTNIPMSLVMRNDLDSRHHHPCILTGYGGFGVPMPPRFSVLVTIMLQFGAIFALPNIRGGSEFGKAWHDAAKRRNRQVAFDDFIGAAEWLCAKGITAPSRLGIFGGSNSGLLVGVAMTQRPDLFRAVLCIAPLLDMVRYEEFNQAHRWQDEFGRADDPDDFRTLYSYSPYHHVENDVDYPATLFVTGDKDDRCNPAHVRKMAARLQNRHRQTNPIIVDYSLERGHSAVLPLSMRIGALTRRIAFLCRQLGVTPTARGTL